MPWPSTGGTGTVDDVSRRTLLRWGMVGAAALATGALVGRRGALRLGAVSPPGARAASDPLPRPPQVDTAPVTPPAPPPPPTAPAALEVLCRDALGLAAAKPGGSAHTVEVVTLHHTGVAIERLSDVPDRLLGHQRHHQAQGWPDIAYHYGVDLAGNIYELRDPAIAPDTFTDYDPAGHVTIVCEGDYDRQTPSDIMLDTVAALATHLCDRFGIPAERLGAHRDHAATACPGSALATELDGLRLEVSRRLHTGVADLRIVCDEDAHDRIAAIRGANGQSSSGA